ncbi:hypothetical protein [Nocardioides jensenii]|uniref:hypothetical protein n=1 Tax=Nocardioides jensenii TaxID=1843 RepID=UPI000830AB3D|nr:hypothetical protein [Nocardioides jensenii]
MNDENQNAQVSAPSGERRPFKERVLGYRGVAAVALASVILGGTGGAALGAISNGSDDGRGGMRGPGGNGPGNFGQLPGQNGQQLPGQDGTQSGDGQDRMAPPDQDNQQDSQQDNTDS